MKRNKKLGLVSLCLLGALLVGCGCQTPSDRDAGSFKSAINIDVVGQSNTVYLVLDGNGNTLAASSRDEGHTATQTTDTKPVTSVAWGNAGGTGTDVVKAAKDLWGGSNATVKATAKTTTDPACTTGNCSD